MKSRIPHRWMVDVTVGSIVRNTVYITRAAALRVADRAREAGHAVIIYRDGIAIA